MKTKKGNLFSQKRSLLEEKYEDRIVEEQKLKSLVPYTGNKEVPFLNIYRFEEAFSFGLVWELLDRVKACETDYVFDPFCGSGTTLFTSFVRGIPSVGVDTLPLAYFVSKTLPTFLFLEEGELTSIWNKVQPEIDKYSPALIAADVPIMKSAFKENVLLKLKKMKSAIDELEEPYNSIFLFLFFSILEECSLTLKENRYPKVKNYKKSSNPIDAMRKKVSKVERDIASKRYPRVCGEKIPDVFLDDTRDLSLSFKRKPTILITSPPYADAVDYTQSYALELCFHFVKNFEEFKELRKNLLRSFESGTREREAPLHAAVKEVVTALKEKMVKPEIPDMVAAYFVDMKKAIKEWYRLLSGNAQTALVVDNQYYQGEVIPVDLILSDMAEEAGFTVETVIVAKYKGLKQVGKVPLRESILVWRKI